MKNTRKRGNGNFWKILAIYGITLTIVIVISLFVLNGILKDYERSMPNNTMDDVIAQFTDDNIVTMLKENNVNFNEFETVEVIADYLKKEIKDNKITYKRKNGEFTNSNPVYLVLAEEEPIAKVTLVEKGKNSHKFTEWKLGTLSFDGYIDSKNEHIISAPSGAEVKINGVTVSEQYLTEEEVSFDPVKNVGSFVQVPTMKEYKIAGLMAEPVITAELNGKELPVKTENKKCTISYPTDTGLLEAQKEHISEINRAYGKYIINRGKLSTLNSYLVGKAKTYLSDIPAVWAFLYGKEYTYEFKNESITNLVRYSDDCYSCDIYYDLYVKWGNGDITYNTSMTYTFVKVKENWKLADFSIN